VTSAPAAVPMAMGEAAAPPLLWRIRGRVLRLDRPLLMGILNVTPDSFSDGGRYAAPDRALARAEELVAEGADILDVGGESTRPGAEPVTDLEEIRRILPVLEGLSERFPEVALSVDTRKASVAREAVGAGASIVNDVSGLADPGMPGVVAGSAAGLVVMHMRGTPQTMRGLNVYGEVAADVAGELRERWHLASAAGIDDEAVVLDPGIGFAKDAAQNLLLLARLPVLTALGRPILLGPSRKAFLGEVLGGAAPEERVHATAAACVVGLMGGARIFRVHDVRAVREALSLAEAVRLAGEG
jgi:dihydropteroate synthase